MIAPGYYVLQVRIATPGDIPLEITDQNGLPVDLTLLAPFKSEIRESPDAPVLMELTIVETDLSLGKINLTWTVADAAALTVMNARWDLLDAAANRWIEGPAVISTKSITIL